MKIKPGYKQTEMGVIPEDWDVAKFGDIASIRNDKAIPLLASARTQCVELESIAQSTGQLLASIEASGPSPKYSFRRGDVLFGRLRPYLRKYWLATFDGLCSTEIWPLIPVTEALSGDFLHLLVQTSDFVAAADVSYGTRMPRADWDVLKELPVRLPPLLEQTAIATVISDVDSLLDGLDRLIAKKRAIKLATMQQLLTGKTRLPGFRGKWEVKPLKQIASISTGINKPLSEMGSGTLYVTVQDLYNGTSIRANQLGRINVSPAEIESRGLTVGDIIFGKSSVKRDGIGYPSRFLGCSEPVVFSGFTYCARACQKTADPTFLFYALRTEQTRRWVIDNSQSSAITNLNQTIANAIPVRLPPTIPEQTAIAAVLTDVDSEIAALEARRDKTRALKYATMGELLTGKTRLVKPKQKDANA